MIIKGTLIVILVLLIFWIIKVSNVVNRAKLKLEEAHSGILIQLRKRYDTLTESMNIAKGYAKHEKYIFENLRRVNDNMSIGEISECIQNHDKCAQRLVALGEAYPELKSSELFMKIQSQLSEENAQLAAAKRAYNANVTSFNKLAVTFPISVVCAIKGTGKQEYLRDDSIEQAGNVNLDWNN